jgi:hypothetical protein
MGFRTDNDTSGASSFILFKVTAIKKIILITIVTDGTTNFRRYVHDPFSVVMGIMNNVKRLHKYIRIIPSYSCLIFFIAPLTYVLTEQTPFPEANTFSFTQKVRHML